MLLSASTYIDNQKVAASLHSQSYFDGLREGIRNLLLVHTIMRAETTSSSLADDENLRTSVVSPPTSDGEGTRGESK
jgi:hypothetical protein